MNSDKGQPWESSEIADDFILQGNFLFMDKQLVCGTRDITFNNNDF